MRRIGTALEWAAGLLLFLLLVVGFLQVVGRYTFVVFMPWTEEMGRLLFVWVVWLGAAAAMFGSGHIRFDFLVLRLPAWLRRPIELAVHVGVATFLVVMIWYGFRVAQAQSGATFLTIDLSVEYTYLSGVVGSALMLVALVGGAWARFRRSGGGQGDRP
jgi:TRAP-type C4-dicarboxylate transport system permease small subunit